MRAASKTIFIYFVLFFVFAKNLFADETLSIDVAGLKRNAILHLPISYNPKKTYPLVLIFHGGGGNAEGMVKFTNFNELADIEGIIAVYPEGTGVKSFLLGQLFATWNSGECCGAAVEKKIDDVGFVKTLLDHLESKYSVDRSRVYATGLSNGAGMVYRLACELSDRIAAIAPVASPDVIGDCAKTRPMPILHLHGKLDPCSVYNGGPCGDCFSKFTEKLGFKTKSIIRECPPIEQRLKFWAERNGCQTDKKMTYREADVECDSFVGCPSNAEVKLCTEEDLGHNWPGQGYNVKSCLRRPNGYVCKAWKSSVGPIGGDLNGNKMIWDFFQHYSLPTTK